MRIVVEISNSTFGRIEKLLDQGRYPSLQRFVAVAVENQLGLEEGGESDQAVRAGTSETERSPVPSPQARVRSFEYQADGWESNQEWPEPHEFEELGYHPGNGEWVWGQVNNVLGIKFVARNLLLHLRASDRQRVVATEWLEKLREDAQTIGRWLRYLDKDEERGRVKAWSKSFPSDEAASSERFARQYAGEVRRSSRVVGALPWLGLVRWFGSPSDGDALAEVGLTDLGYRFAQLNSPLFDTEDATSGIQAKLSQEERKLYRNEIAHLPGPEREAFECIGSILADTDTIPARELRERIGARYEDWSSAQATTYSGGALARMDDVGLLRRFHPGTSRAAYSASDALHAYLDGSD